MSVNVFSVLAPGNTVHRYRITNFLGVASMGYNYQAEVLEHPGKGQQVFLKMIKRDRSSRPTFWEYVVFQNEVANRLRDPSFRDFCYQPFEFFVTTASGDHVDPSRWSTIKEPCAYFQAFQWLDSSQGMALSKYEEQIASGAIREDWYETLTITRTLIAAVRAMHSVGIVHADLKPPNFFLLYKANVRRALLLDFDCCAIPGMDNKWIGYTPFFQSPEHVNGTEISSASDVFTLALIVSSLLCKARPFYDGSASYSEEQYRKDIQRGPVPPDFFEFRGALLRPDRTPFDSAELQHLRETLSMALHPDPRKRPSAKDLWSALVGSTSSGTARVPMVLIQAGSRSGSELRVNTSIGQRFLNGRFSDVNWEYWSDPQCHLVFKNGQWLVQHHPQATNATFLDGSVIRKEDVLSPGKHRLAVGNPTKGEDSTGILSIEVK